MIKLISATVLSVAFCSSCSACWFPFFPAYSAGYPAWGMPGPVYSAGYAPMNRCGYGAGYAPYSASYAPYSASYAGYASQVGCSTCGQTCGGSCGTFGSTVNYLGGINLGCGSGNCGSVNCIPDSNITNRPVPDTGLDDVRPSDRTYEGDRNDNDRGSTGRDSGTTGDSNWPRDRDTDRDPNGGVRGDDFGNSGGSTGSDRGTGSDIPDWRNRSRTPGTGSDVEPGGMFGTEGDRSGTFGGSRRPTIDDPATFGSEGAAGDPDVINRGANKPPMSDPLEADGEVAPESQEEGEGDLLAPEPPDPTARRNSNLFFASQRELRSSHSEARSRQRLAGGREGNSRTTKISNNEGRSKAPRWISLPMPVGQTRL